MSEYIECLDSYDDAARCSGDVDYYYALSGSGSAYPRCEAHYELYVERVQPQMDEIRSRYPDSHMAPSWYQGDDYAGERWDDDY